MSSAFEEMFARSGGFHEPVLVRTIVNPMYATTHGNPALLAVTPDLEPDDWVELQAGVIEGFEEDEERVEGAGIDHWLNTMLACLEGELPADHPVSPARAVAVDPVLLEEHPALVDRAVWKGAQARVVEEHGLFTWLDELLAAIGGAKVVTGPDGQPMIDDTEPPGVPADELEAFVLGALRTALEAGALEHALEQAGLVRNEVVRAIDEETIDSEMLGKLVSQVLVGGLHDPEFDASSYDYEANVTFVWPALRNEPCPCGSGKKFKHCHGG